MAYRQESGSSRPEHTHRRRSKARELARGAEVKEVVDERSEDNRPPPAIPPLLRYARTAYYPVMLGRGPGTAALTAIIIGSAQVSPSEPGVGRARLMA